MGVGALGYWYPVQKRVEALTGELKALEQFALQPVANPASSIAGVSAALKAAAQAENFPSHQLRRWIWIASLYRQHAASGGPLAGVVGAALAFLAKRSAATIDDAVVQDLNWVVETTTRSLCESLGEGLAQSYLTSAETAEIERRLTQYDAELFDAQAVRGIVAQKLDDLGAFSEATALGRFGEKVDALFAAAHRSSLAGKAARAALLYLADENDIVRDSEGLLGLLDDVYVIDVAYAEVEQQTRCLPLLQGLLEDYAYVADLAVIGSPVRALDLYGQYVVCAALEALFALDRSTMLVLRESGPFPLLAALFAAIETARRQASVQREQLGRWPSGAPITITDGGTRLKAVFLDQILIGAQIKLRLKVDKEGTVTVPLDVAPYIALSAKPHARLSTGQAVSEWLRSRHADPLVNLTGTGRTRATAQECILLLGPRSKIDELAAHIRPLGAEMGAIMGVRYVMADGRYQDVSGSATDAPYIYACSDADTAYDLVRSPPAGVVGWRVVVDGAREMRNLMGTFASDGENDVPPICAFAELFDRETSAELAKADLHVWYLEDQDVQPPPQEARSAPQGDRVARMLARQGAHWTSVSNIHLASHPFLESVEAWLAKIQAQRGSGEGLRNLELLVSTFLRAALARPFASPQSDETLRSLARGVAMHAATERHYSMVAGELYELFSPTLKGAVLAFDRRAAIEALPKNASDAAITAVVCRSAQIASASAAAGDVGLGRVVWTNLEGVRAGAPYDRIVVSGWLDRMSMRELAGNGYAPQLDLVFYPFERRWFERTMSASGRWERRIEEKTLDTLAGVRERLRTAGRDAGLWRRQTSERIDVTKPMRGPDLVDEEIDAAEVLETRRLDIVKAAVLSGREHHPTVRAQLVMFERPGTYAFLPGNGKVIVLGSFGAEDRVEGDAEKMLLRNVSSLEPGDLLALPVAGDRDLIDARADEFIGDAAAVRAKASLWKTALNRYAALHHLDAYSLAGRLSAAGVRRHGGTVRYWMAGTATLAPRGFRDVIKVIADLTRDQDLVVGLSEVLSSIDLIYRARTRAAGAIVAEVFAGEIDLAADELTFSLGAATLRYGLHRIESIEGLCDVPHEVVGQIRHLFEANTASPSPGVEARADA
jgi:hypothetical protein